MNPLTKVKLINELNEREARLGVKESVSWHQDYKDSAWIFMGGLPYELTEGDIICVFSQYGEVVNINLVREKISGRSRGFCFLCYEDQRSTVLAVDNFNGIKMRGRAIRVDHVANYRPPKDADDIDEVTKMLREKGCGAQTHSSLSSGEEEEESTKLKKHKKTQSKENADRNRIKEVIKQEPNDPGYEKYSNIQTTSKGINRKNTSDGQSTSGNLTNMQKQDYDKCKVQRLEENSNIFKNKHQTFEKKRLKELKKKRQ